MSTITVEKDTEALSFTITARFDAPLERVWQVWSDPRQLERWWGPPTYPATVTEHDLTPGGRVAYYMTGPEGDRHHGWWEVLAVEAPHRLEFDDGFAEPDGTQGRRRPRDPGRRQPHPDRGRHRDGGALGLPLGGGHGADGRDGHGGGHDPRHGPDRRHPPGRGLSHVPGDLRSPEAAWQHARLLTHSLPAPELIGCAADLQFRQPHHVGALHHLGGRHALTLPDPPRCPRPRRRRCRGASHLGLGQTRRHRLVGRGRLRVA